MGGDPRKRGIHVLPGEGNAVSAGGKRQADSRYKSPAAVALRHTAASLAAGFRVVRMAARVGPGEGRRRSRDVRFALIACLCGDFAGLLGATAACHLFFG